MKRWPFILLVVSLVANLFLVGIVAGGVWHWTHGQGDRGRGNWRMRVAESLPGPQGDAMRHAMRDTFRAARPIADAGRAARGEAARLLIQPQVDIAATGAAFDRARNADMVVRARVERRLVDFAAGLPLDQRRKLADALKPRPRRDRGH